MNLPGVQINPGVRTVYQSSFNDYRRELAQKAKTGAEYDDKIGATSDVLGQAVYDRDVQQTNLKKSENMAKYLMTLGEAAAGRGINKSVQSPAELQQLRPQNPQFFGLGRKDAIPYQKVISDGQNLKAILKGFQEVRGLDGVLPDDAGNIISQAQRRAGLVNEAFNKPKRESIYAGVPKDAAINLYQIKLRNQRRDSMYAFY